MARAVELWRGEPVELAGDVRRLRALPPESEPEPPPAGAAIRPLARDVGAEP